MEKKPEEEIMLDPRWSILQDGLGYQVLLVGGMPTIDKEGREIVNLVIKPDDIVRKRYNYRRDEELDNNGNVRLIVLKEDLIPMNLFDDANRKWLYVKSFRHEATAISEREKELKIKINAIKREFLLLDADNMRLYEQLELAKTNPGKFIKQGTEVYQEVGKVISDIINKKEQ